MQIVCVNILVLVEMKAIYPLHQPKPDFRELKSGGILSLVPGRESILDGDVSPPPLRPTHYDGDVSLPALFTQVPGALSCHVELTRRALRLPPPFHTLFVTSNSIAALSLAPTGFGHELPRQRSQQPPRQLSADVTGKIPEKTRRPTASSGTIPTCENPVSRPGTEPGDVMDTIAGYLGDQSGAVRPVPRAIKTSFRSRVGDVSHVVFLSGEEPESTAALAHDVVTGDGHPCIETGNFPVPYQAAPSQRQNWFLTKAATREQNRVARVQRSEFDISHSTPTLITHRRDAFDCFPVLRNSPKETWRRDGVVVKLLASHQGESSSIPGGVTCGNRSRRCHWLAGILGDLPSSPPVNSVAAPYSTRITLIGSQDLEVKSQPNLFTHSHNSRKPVDQRHRPALVSPAKTGRDLCPVAPTSSPIRDRMILVPNQDTCNRAPAVNQAQSSLVRGACTLAAAPQQHHILVYCLNDVNGIQISKRRKGMRISRVAEAGRRRRQICARKYASCASITRAPTPRRDASLLGITAVAGIYDRPRRRACQHTVDVSVFPDSSRRKWGGGWRLFWERRLQSAGGRVNWSQITAALRAGVSDPRPHCRSLRKTSGCVDVGGYSPFTITSNFPEVLLKFYFQVILPTLANEGTTVAERLACSPSTNSNWVQSPPCSLRSLACGNRARRCRWSAGFLGDLPFPPPLYSSAAPYSPQLPLSALKISMLRAVQISLLPLENKLCQWGRAPHS
ncbi:hypothetical protein PR048_017055 [Dryococelus australis]|uniref:Uncharacterized protein n=1 Tax=Dryococelus australis TaxID=614101 RepID=A0ABQ9H8N6_9NEOP|nr:hypothetical protein PR048_017055 [Dryococelus australis]